jgi:hypothetical protein
VYEWCVKIVEASESVSIAVQNCLDEHKFDGRAGAAALGSVFHQKHVECGGHLGIKTGER